MAEIVLAACHRRPNAPLAAAPNAHAALRLPQTQELKQGSSSSLTTGYRSGGHRESSLAHSKTLGSSRLTSSKATTSPTSQPPVSNSSSTPTPRRFLNNSGRTSYATSDLDAIFTGYHAINGDARGTEKLGDFEVVSQSSKPSRRVTTHSDWILAFELYREAVAHAYPHRKQELSVYQRYVSRLFHLPLHQDIRRGLLHTIAPSASAAAVTAASSYPATRASTFLHSMLTDPVTDPVRAAQLPGPRLGCRRAAAANIAPTPASVSTKAGATTTHPAVTLTSVPSADPTATSQRSALARNDRTDPVSHSPIFSRSSCSPSATFLGHALCPYTHTMMTPRQTLVAPAC